MCEYLYEVQIDYMYGHIIYGTKGVAKQKIVERGHLHTGKQLPQKYTHLEFYSRIDRTQYISTGMFSLENSQTNKLQIRKCNRVQNSCQEFILRQGLCKYVKERPL